MDKIYYVEAYSIEEIDEEYIKKSLEMERVKHGPNWKMSLDEYKKFLHSWGKDKYTFSGEIISFHETKEEAIEAAVNNYGDINEAGCFEYAAVVGAPLGTAYYETSVNPKEDIFVFKFNHDIGKYEEISKDNELYVRFKYAAWHMGYNEEHHLDV